MAPLLSVSISQCAKWQQLVLKVGKTLSVLARAAIRKGRKLGGPKDREVLSRNSRSWESQIKVLTGLAPAAGMREASLPGRPPWFTDGHLQAHTMLFLPLCLPMSTFPPFIRKQVILDQGPPLLQNDLILMNYGSNNPRSISDHILRHWGFELQHVDVETGTTHSITDLKN